jgi:hypothetical protein
MRQLIFSTLILLGMSGAARADVCQSIGDTADSWADIADQIDAKNGSFAADDIKAINSLTTPLIKDTADLAAELGSSKDAGDAALAAQLSGYMKSLEGVKGKAQVDQVVALLDKITDALDSVSAQCAKRVK